MAEVGMAEGMEVLRRAKINRDRKLQFMTVSHSFSSASGP